MEVEVEVDAPPVPPVRLRYWLFRDWYDTWVGPEGPVEDGEAWPDVIAGPAICWSKEA